MQIANTLAINGVANSSTVLSAAISSRFFTSVSAVATFTDAAAAGTLKLQTTNDIAVNSATKWVDVPSTSQTVASGATTLIPITQVCYEWLRISFASSGGGGTFTVRLKVLEAI